MIEDHPNYSNLETFKDSVISVIQAAQSEFFVAFQHYFQGLRIPEIGEDEFGLIDADKMDGTTTEKINIHIKPSDVDWDWGDFDKNNFKVNTRFPCHVMLDVYKTPADGWGWTVTLEFWYAGIDPDAYGNTGDHWIYRHTEGPWEGNVTWIYDEWVVRTDPPPAPVPE